MNVCLACRERDPEFFDVPDDVWNHYIKPASALDGVICLKCWAVVIKRLDGGAYARRHEWPFGCGPRNSAADMEFPPMSRPLRVIGRMVAIRQPKP